MHRTFDPSVPSEFTYIISNQAGEYHPVTITIPAIPYNHLFIDDLEGINLGYNQETDTFNINPDNPDYMKLVPGDLLRLKIDSYNFGTNTVAEGMTITFEAAGGPYKGLPVRYNLNRSPDAPAIMLSLKLNPEAKAYEVLNSLNDAARLLSVMINENGDGTNGFIKTDMPFEIAEEQMVNFEINHLCSIGFIVEDADKLLKFKSSYS